MLSYLLTKIMKMFLNSIQFEQFVYVEFVQKYSL